MIYTNAEGEPFDPQPVRESLTSPNRDWIGRVKEADSRAEGCWKMILEYGAKQPPEQIMGAALIAIAAELRAQRIARRPGAGQ